DVESALTDLKRLSENGTIAELKPAIEKLQQASYKMAELLYQKTQASGAASGNGAASEQQTADGEQPPGAGAPNEDVIDAEFKESK
ncbi:MAG: molecular chaperone DnaK, partial [Candidatus Eremiobacteraeota bacterium]|nr:molecular chaperone DnaK [Candidatus Eremiobacteraeota bacterium]